VQETSTTLGNSGKTGRNTGERIFEKNGHPRTEVIFYGLGFRTRTAVVASLKESSKTYHGCNVFSSPTKGGELHITSSHDGPERIQTERQLKKKTKVDRRESNTLQE